MSLEEGVAPKKRATILAFGWSCRVRSRAWPSRRTCPTRTRRKGPGGASRIPSSRTRSLADRSPGRRRTESSRPAEVLMVGHLFLQGVHFLHLRELARDDPLERFARHPHKGLQVPGGDARCPATRPHTRGRCLPVDPSVSSSSRSGAACESVSTAPAASRSMKTPAVLSSRKPRNSSGKNRTRSFRRRTPLWPRLRSPAPWPT